MGDDQVTEQCSNYRGIDRLGAEVVGGWGGGGGGGGCPLLTLKCTRRIKWECLHIKWLLTPLQRQMQRIMYVNTNLKPHHLISVNNNQIGVVMQGDSNILLQLFLNCKNSEYWEQLKVF